MALLTSIDFSFSLLDRSVSLLLYPPTTLLILSLGVVLGSSAISKILRVSAHLVAEETTCSYLVRHSAITEAPTADELYNGKRPDQYDAPGGYINTGFGRVFINFLKLNN